MKKYHVVFPHRTVLERTQRTWAAKARLTVENGVVVDLNECDALIVLLYDDWEKDTQIKKSIKFAKDNHIDVEFLDPHSWAPHKEPIKPVAVKVSKKHQKTLAV